MRVFWGILVLSAMTWPATAWTRSNATDIIRRGETRMRGRTAQSLMVMRITRPDFTRELKLRALTSGGERALVEILEPVKETGIASLRVGVQMWNYLPKSDQTVRVPPSMMLQSWMGSDFTNDDLVKASSLVRDYRHRLVSGAKGPPGSVLVLCVPKPGAPVVWGKILHWARRADSLPLRQEYYDEQGKLVRTLVFSAFRKMDDRVIPTRIRVAKADAPGETTVVEYRRTLYDRRIPNEIFNRNRLRLTSEKGRDVASLWEKRNLVGVRGRLALVAGQSWGVGR
jgi:hypothetical protein